ncbi:MAG: twin-arginine translocase TatA/TatE family subunit [Candidatus Poseidonia sp.]|nr:twin-arginine translocase TatA/TatE family subunit [Poseidonia sp.]MBL6747853.1 twin-arginine translocase TatA/TatE family subunit [Poseidonia sp.]MBL6806732.1 twin-arginine translocase TatA/TatE family subunit [Poseidonia sp.]MBL6892861.1 twin-arginine translocase TatA/TatE family subunit [Poseidonia sp.]
MVGGIGPLELTILLGLLFILFGADKLPEMANALGRSKGEFQKGLNDTNQLATATQTVTDLEAGGRTPDQVLMERAKAVGMNPAGMAIDELEKKVTALEALSSDE